MHITRSGLEMRNGATSEAIVQKLRRRVTTTKSVVAVSCALTELSFLRTFLHPSLS